MMDAAVRSPQLTATMMRLPAVLLAAKARAIDVAAVSLVAVPACTKVIGTMAGVTVRGIDPETEPDTALIVVVPGDAPVASP